MFALALALLADPVLAADASKPHEHQGIVKAYAGAPAPVALSAEDEAKLAAGGLVMKQVQTGNGGHAVAFQDINAPTSRVWSRILSFSSYPQWVDNVQTCETYRKEGSSIYVRFVLSVMGIGVEYFVKHQYTPGSNHLTWTLDYSRQSDLDDSVGYWRVTPHPSDPNRTRLEYSVDVRFKGWIPGFVQNYISSKGLTNAVAWVKKQSEAG